MKNKCTLIGTKIKTENLNLLKGNNKKNKKCRTYKIKTLIFIRYVSNFLSL